MMIPRSYRLAFVLIFVIGTSAYSQFFNKEVSAQILVERNSEYLKFIAMAENLTPADYSLRYDFMVFKKDENGNTVKNNQEDRFVLAAREKKILSNLAISYNINQEVILMLIIYDKDDKPIGQNRIVLEKGGQTEFELSGSSYTIKTADQSKPKDGFVLDGLVIENTITKAGKDFYRYFYSEYFNKQIASPKNILIEEVPGRGRFTRVSVKVADQLVWQFFAQPRKEILKKNASIALSRSIAYLQQLEQRQQEFIRY